MHDEVISAKIILAAAILLAAGAVRASEGASVAVSPDGRNRIDCEGGRITVRRDGRTLFGPQAVALALDRGTARVELAARDDGVAYRFVADEDGEVTVRDETAELVFPSPDTEIWAGLNWCDNPSDPKQDKLQHGCSSIYSRLTPATFPPDGRRLAYLPLTVRFADGTTALVTESDLRDYAGLHIRRDGGDTNRLRGVFGKYPVVEKERPEYKQYRRVTERRDYIVRTRGRRAFPWRVFALADRPIGIVEQRIVRDLAAPASGDWSWVRPGPCAWEWWNACHLEDVPFKPGINTATYCAYADFAADYGLPWMLVDEGWNDGLDLRKIVPAFDLDAIVRHAAARKVQVMLWTAWRTIDGRQEDYFAHFAQRGVKGFKIDFMERDDAEMVNFMERTLQVAAKYRLCVDFHGSGKPTGLERTYPNLIGMEGVHGLELMKLAMARNDDFLTHDCQVVFTRAPLGMLDYTPGAMCNRLRKDWKPDFANPCSQGTRVRQMALYTLFPVPLQMLCDSPSRYRRNPECTRFIASVPTVWDETRGLCGEIGRFASVARRSGGEWWIGAITDAEPRTLAIDTSFLGKGRWRAEVFADADDAGVHPEHWRRTVVEFAAGEPLPAKLASGGGWTARLCAAPSAGGGFDLSRIPDVRIFRGDAVTAYRDPAVYFEDGTFHLFFTLSKVEADGRNFGYTAQSESRDLVHWTEPRILTPRDQNLNYSSPGNVVKVGADYYLCLQTYPTPGSTTNKVMYATGEARIFTMRTRDFRTWDEPRLLRVKGDDVPREKMGRMIDPYLVKDADGRWHCFYKQNGASFSVSSDLVHWTYVGRTDAGENVCVIPADGGGWLMFHSPPNGIGVKRSPDLVHWQDVPGLITLGQKDWLWARGRLTAGAVLDCRGVKGIGKYLLFFHGSGPKHEWEGDFSSSASIGLAWSDDLVHWSWPGNGWTWITGESNAFAKTVACPCDLARAVLRHTGLGVYEITVNGARVGDVELKPGFTSPEVRESHEDDITALLRPGEENVISVMGSDAYWRDLIAGNPGLVGSRTNGFAAALTIERKDGTSETLRTGPDWEIVTSPLRSAGVYEGEEYAANARSRRRRQPARVFDPGVRVVPARGVVRARPDLMRAAKAPFKLQPGERKVVDFGQNAAGREVFTARGAEGTRIEIRHAEALNPDGTCYFGNLRRAKATTVYVMKGGEAETFRPLHTYYGFRYAEIAASAPVEFLSLAREPITSVRDETGRIVTSDPDVNRIISCAEWAIRSNQTGVPTDCCQRGERLGWMGDACVSVPAACWLWDAREFYLGKVARDQRELQHEDGRYCSLSPGRGGETGEDKYGIAGWSDAGVLIPYRVARHFGDFACAAEHYPSMRDYGRWLEEKGGPFPGYWGDWLAFQRTGYGEVRYPYGSDPDTYAFLSAAFRAWDFAALADFAAAYGEAGDAKRFAADREKALAALHGRFFEGGRLRRAYAAQTTYAMALALGLCPDEASRRATADDLELNVIRSGRRLMTGVIGTQFLLEALSENGKASLAYDILLGRACPSWRYMVDRGATTTWERWDGILSDGSFNDPKMNSFNHADFACVLDWMYRTMAGIRPNPRTGGFDDFELVPRPDRRIRTVEASYRTAKGTIRVKSEYGADGRWSYSFTVPAGTRATVRPPSGAAFRAEPGDHTWRDGLQAN